MQAGDALVGIDHGEGRTLRIDGCDVVLDRLLLGFRQRLDLGQQIAEAVVEVDAELIQRRGMLLDHIGEVDRDGMAEHDGISDLHHGRFDVQREQNALLLGVLDLLGEEGAQCLAAHHGGVDDLAGVDLGLRFQHSCLAIGAGQLDANVGRGGDRGRDFRAEVIA